MSTEIAFELNRTADWREEKAKKYPEDTRNAAAAQTLRVLATQAISDDAMEAYSAAFAEYEAAFDGIDSVADVESFLAQEDMVEGLNSEDMRRIGFGWSPAHIDEVMISLADNYKTATARVVAAIEKAKRASSE